MVQDSGPDGPGRVVEGRSPWEPAGRSPTGARVSAGSAITGRVNIRAMGIRIGRRGAALRRRRVGLSGPTSCKKGMAKSTVIGVEVKPRKGFPGGRAG